MVRSDPSSTPGGGVSDHAIAELVGLDDPSDEVVEVRSDSPVLAMFGAIVAVTIGDLRRGDEDALAWIDGEIVEGPAISLADVAEAFGLEPATLRAMIVGAAARGHRARRHEHNLRPGRARVVQVRRAG